MKVLNVFSVSRWDGGDRTNFAFYLANKSEADAYASTHRQDEVRPVTLTIFDTVAEAEANDVNVVRERALSKLTARERAALGV